MAGVSLLLIDDDPVLGRFTQSQLSIRGCRVKLVPSAADGLDQVHHAGFDVVVLDRGMAGRPDHRLLDTILAIQEGPPVVLLTGPSHAAFAVAGRPIACVVKDLGNDFIDALESVIRGVVSESGRRLAQREADRDMRDARDRFEALAAERQILMHEVNHRVGNSLQLVGAFLHMQSSSSTSQETRQALGEANRRVLAVAQVHRRLYATDDVQSVALTQYLSTLVDDIRESTDVAGIGELLTFAADDVQIDPDSAVTIGIIVTELVINAMKHAYPVSGGPIRVMLRAGTEAGSFRLLVEDDGVGRRQDTGSPTGIGDTIVRAMASKLSATVEYDVTASGTRAGMTFTVHRPAG